MPLATKDDVLEVLVTSPDGTIYRAEAGSTPRRMGSAQDTCVVVVQAGSRLKEALEFDGSFTASKQGNFTRTILPKPDAGTSVSAVGWNVSVDPVKEAGQEEDEEPSPGAGEPFDVGPLILVEASVISWSRAESSLGKPLFDTGEDRPERWQLSLADARIFWSETGFISGRRNFRDDVSTYNVLLTEDKREVTITAPKIKVEVETDDDGVRRPTISLDEPEQIRLELPGIIGFFDPASVRSEDGKPKLKNATDLFEEIAKRCPHLKAWPNGKKVGPPEMTAILDKMFTLDVDYKRAMAPGAAFDMLSGRLGLVHGLQLDSRFTLDFDGMPLNSLFKESGVIGKQLSWLTEDHAARIKVRTTGVRFYPSRVVKQVPVPDWELIAKDDKNEIISIFELAKQVGLEDRVGEIAYAMAAKGQQELPNDKTPTENQFLKELEKTIPRDRVQKFRRLADWTFRGYRYAPTPDTRLKVQEIIAESQVEALKDLETSSEPLGVYPQGGRDVEDVVVAVFPLNVSAMVDKLLEAPFKLVTNIDGVGQLTPVFYGDFILHRYFNFLETGRSIAEAVFDPSQAPPAFLRDKFEKLLEEFAYLDFKRRPMDWAEAGAQKLTLQTLFRTSLGQLDGTMTDEKIQEFWHGLQAFKGLAPPLEVWVTWISGDASEFVDNFDPRSAVVRFKVPLGRFLESKSFTHFLRDSARVLSGLSFLITEENFSQGNVPVEQTDSVTFELWAEALYKILENDRVDSAVIKRIPEDIPDRPEPDEFKKMVRQFRRRSPGTPLWQVASLKVSVEVEPRENPTPGSPDDVEAMEDTGETEVLLDVPIPIVDPVLVGLEDPIPSPPAGPVGPSPPPVEAPT